MSEAARETARIADQLRRALRGPAWHGDSLDELLAGVTAAQAARVAIPGAHTIHQLVLHLAAWAEVARERIETRATREVPEAENFPSPGDWSTDLARLYRATDRLAHCAEALSEPDLNFVFASNGQTLYRLLHGVVQHHLYHAGQIALLKKML